MPELWSGALGTGYGLGWVDTALPPISWVLTVTVFAGVVFWGLKMMSVRKAIALVLVIVALVAVPLYILVHDRIVLPNAIQPRYIYPILILLAGVALLGLRGLRIELGRTQVILVAVMLFVANAMALNANMRRYVSGIDVSGPNLNRAIEWWWGIPISPMGMWAVGTIAFGIALAGVACAALRTPLVKDAAASSAPLDTEPVVIVR